MNFVMRITLIVVVPLYLLFAVGCFNFSNEQWSQMLAPAVYDGLMFRDLPESSGVIFVEDCPIEGAFSSILILDNEKRLQYLQFIAGQADYTWIKEWSLQIRCAAKTDVLLFVKDSIELLRSSDVSVAVLAFSDESELHYELKAIVSNDPQFVKIVPFNPLAFHQVPTSNGRSNKQVREK